MIKSVRNLNRREKKAGDWARKQDEEELHRNYEDKEIKEVIEGKERSGEKGRRKRERELHDGGKRKGTEKWVKDGGQYKVYPRCGRELKAELLIGRLCTARWHRNIQRNSRGQTSRVKSHTWTKIFLTWHIPSQMSGNFFSNAQNGKKKKNKKR